ncbi:MAG: hypothetical protein H6727_01415 [Myxococcales bacterium]|nr:hypothetical protein [Myxococcales bacterium]
MASHPRRSWRDYALYGVVGGWLIASSYLAACQANVDLISEKRRLDRIEGTPRCEEGLRVVGGASGTATMRVYLVDDDGEEIPPGRLETSTSPFTAKDNLSLRPNSIRVLDADTGNQIPSVTADISIEEGRSDGWIQENPNYTAAKQNAENLRAPRAISFLLDMSETAASQDQTRERSSAPAGWVLSVLNERQENGNLDAFALLLMRNNLFTRTDNMFIGEDTDLQLIGVSNQPRGFLVSTGNEKDKISRAFLNISNGQVNLNAPLYGTIREAAVLTRDVSWNENGDTLNNPAVIAITVSQDAHVLKPNDVTDEFANAQTALRGTNGQFVPFMGITYPKPSGVKDDAWEDHLNKICEMARVAGSGGVNYFGQVFYARRNLELTTGSPQLFQDAVRDQLDMAFHAMGGWLELKVKYTLTGAQTGKRYLVAFGLNGTFLGEKTKEAALGLEKFLVFEVKM